MALPDKTKKQEVPTKLNEVQLQLLQMFNRKMSEEETMELKKHILKFYENRFDKKLDEMYESGEMTTEKWDSMFKKTLKRTPYPSK